MRTRLVVFLFALSFGVFGSGAASANVVANPSYYDFGAVKPGSSSSMTVAFTNFSNQTIQFFNAYCSGDLSAYQCQSSCFMLLPFSSCHVQVYFTPRNGDGLRRSVYVQGYGSGAFATSTVFGTDAK